MLQTFKCVNKFLKICSNFFVKFFEKLLSLLLFIQKFYIISKNFKIIKIFSKCLILLTNFKNVFEILWFLCIFYNLVFKYLKYVVNKVENGEKMVKFYIFLKNGEMVKKWWLKFKKNFTAILYFFSRVHINDCLHKWWKPFIFISTYGAWSRYTRIRLTTTECSSREWAI